jgi:hypothetical protein
VFVLSVWGIDIRRMGNNMSGLWVLIPLMMGEKTIDEDLLKDGIEDFAVDTTLFRYRTQMRYSHDIYFETQSTLRNKLRIKRQRRFRT